MSYVGVMIRFEARSGQRQALLDHLEAASQFAVHETRTDLWLVGTTPSEQNTVSVLEVYKSPADKIAHESSREYVAAKQRTEQFLDAPPEILPLAPTAGKGLS